MGVPQLMVAVLLVSFSPQSQAAPASASPSPNYGYWNVNATNGNNVSGLRWGDIYSEHSLNPGEISHIFWTYDQPTKLLSVTHLQGRFFVCDLIDTVGIQPLQFWQTVPISGVDIALTGSATIEITLSPLGNGRGGEGSTTITATLNEGEAEPTWRP